MPSSKPATTRAPGPVMRVTLYDQVSSWAISLFCGLLVICGFVVFVFVSTRVAKPQGAVPVELIEAPGGYEDGAPNETLRVDSPEPETRDASPADTNEDQVQIAETIDSVVSTSDAVSQQVQQQFEMGIESTGRGGSAKGTGRRPLGVGGGGGGIPREQRWFIKFGDRIPLEEYAKQLEFFGIELGALLPDGRLAYLSKLTAPTPQVRYEKSGANEQRLYMTWQGGERRSADVGLFAKANVQVNADTLLFHFYSKNTENTLAQLEVNYRNRPASQIRRTYFQVDSENGKYQFSVYRQIYH